MNTLVEVNPNWFEWQRDGHVVQGMNRKGVRQLLKALTDFRAGRDPLVVDGWSVRDGGEGVLWVTQHLQDLPDRQRCLAVSALTPFIRVLKSAVGP